MGAYEEKLVYESYNDVMLSISKIQWNTSTCRLCAYQMRDKYSHLPQGVLCPCLQIKPLTHRTLWRSGVYLL